MRIWSYILLSAMLAGTAVGAEQAKTQQTAPKKPAAPKKAVPIPGEAGLYMTFDTTMGSIRCKLYENEAPVTVRTLVGLAIGKQSYVDPRTKQTVSGKRFYDGLTFHRVVPSFMMQGGDPLGTGAGGPEGPGFPFQDEFVPTLRFDVPGRLAMANAGPRTNASQFFITEVPTPFLNDRHTIFGQCGNLDVVKAIAAVPTRGESPTKPIIMKRVVVERIGPAPANAPEAMPSKRLPAKTGVAPAKKTPAPAKKH